MLYNETVIWPVVSENALLLVVLFICVLYYIFKTIFDLAKTVKITRYRSGGTVEW